MPDVVVGLKNVSAECAIPTESSYRLARRTAMLDGCYALLNRSAADWRANPNLRRLGLQPR